MFLVICIKNNVLNIHTLFLESSPSNIYHGIKGFGIFSSVFASSVTCKIYRYIERNEVVHKQSMIEEQSDKRELLLNNRFKDNKSSYKEYY